MRSSLVIVAILGPINPFPVRQVLDSGLGASMQVLSEHECCLLVKESYPFALLRMSQLLPLQEAHLTV
jgi:hypothetical protein